MQSRRIVKLSTKNFLFREMLPSKRMPEIVRPIRQQDTYWTIRSAVNQTRHIFLEHPTEQN